MNYTLSAVFLFNQAVILKNVSPYKNFSWTLGFFQFVASLTAEGVTRGVLWWLEGEGDPSGVEGEEKR